MKAIFLYSKLTGNSLFLHHLDFIVDSLKKRFGELKIVESNDLKTLNDTCKLACKEYDYFIFIGGDGTVNKVINNISVEKRRPIIGYIPGGTTNDFAKNYHLKFTIKKAVETIINGKEVPIDVIRANDRYFGYILATGAFSEISYTAKRKFKKLLGFFSYYALAVRDCFIPKKIEGTLTANGKTYEINTPFLMALNSKFAGGFPVSFNNKVNDGKFQVYATKQGIFNGLPHYALGKIRTLKLSTDEFTFTFKNNVSPWCVDGEKENLGNVHVKLYPSHLKIIIPRKYADKLTK